MTEKDEAKKHRYSPEGKPMADAIARTISDEGMDLFRTEPHPNSTDEERESLTTVHADPEKAMLFGYMAGFETALHVALCGNDPTKLVTVLAMALDQSIHDGDTVFHEIAEDLIAKLKVEMLAQTLREGGEVNGVTGFVIDDPDSKTPEQLNAEISLGIAGVLAKVMPKKDKDDA